MSDVIRMESYGLQRVEPRVEFVIRAATMADYAWIDAMHKAETDKLGFLVGDAITKRIEQGNVLVAEATGTGRWDLGVGAEHSSSLTPNSQLPPPNGRRPLGYCIAVDRYMKQDHVGQFIQLNIAPEHRRGLVGAALVKATFEKAAYGVKLFGLWCRQDLAANTFWEALGFVPLAFRTAGVSTLEKLKRQTGSISGGVHIYWQRRVREGDTETAYWYPYETQGGMMAESRVVLPIPPGSSWRDVEPVVLPGAERRAEEARLLEAKHSAKVEADKAALAEKRREARAAAKEAQRIAAGPKVVHGVEVCSKAAAGVPMGFGVSPEVQAQREAERVAAEAAAKKQRMKQEKRAAKDAAKQARRKTDPELLAFSRELRDRWQDAVRAEPGLLLERQAGKYEVGRLLELGNGSASDGVGEREQVRWLEAA